MRARTCSSFHPDECIDCGVCEPECPVDAIKPDTEPGIEKWLEINAQYAQVWPNITIKREPPPDAKDWEGKPDKAELLSPKSSKRRLSRGPSARTMGTPLAGEWRAMRDRA